LRRLAVMRAVLLFLLFRVAVTAMIIFAIHKTSYNMHKESAWRRRDEPACDRQAEAHPYTGVHTS
jgi:hypothetical protein